MQIHYNFDFELETNTFSFTTKNNFYYKAVFSIDETLKSVSQNEKIDNVYTFVLEKITPQKDFYDVRVSKTVDKIIQLFFSNNKNSLLYICDNIDNKAFKRSLAYKRWYNNSEFKNNITKIDFNYLDEANDFEYFSSLLYHKENPDKKIIVEAFHCIEKYLNDDK